MDVNSITSAVNALENARFGQLLDMGAKGPNAARLATTSPQPAPAEAEPVQTEAPQPIPQPAPSPQKVPLLATPTQTPLLQAAALQPTPLEPATLPPAALHTTVLQPAPLQSASMQPPALRPTLPQAALLQPAPPQPPPRQIAPTQNATVQPAPLQTAPLQSAPGRQPIAQTPATDISTTLLNDIAAPDIARLSAALEPHRTPEVAARVTELTQQATVALAQNDRSRALANVTEIASLDPHSVEPLQTNKVFEPIHPEVDHLLNRLTTVAKMNAEGLLAQAAETLESPAHVSLTNLPASETLLHVAQRFFDAGGYTNYVRSGDLAQAIANPLAYSPFLTQYAEALAAKPISAPLRPESIALLPKSKMLSTAHQTLTTLREAASPRLQILWRRAPLLVLLLGWLSAGLIAGPASILLRSLWPDAISAALIDFGFNLWATGFLALVCFGFYARIRHLRS